MKTIVKSLIMLAMLGLCYLIISYEWAVLIGLSALLINTNEK
jgi:hypothetical protein